MDTDKQLAMKPVPLWPGLRAWVAGRSWRLLILGVGTVTISVGFIAYFVFLDRLGSTNGTSATTDALPPNEMVIKDLNQLELLGLTKLTQQARKILKDLEKFDAEAKRYYRRFEELNISIKAGELVKYQEVTKYFHQYWDERLPAESDPDDYRHNLGILLKTVHEAIDKDKGYVPKQLTYDEIDTIAFKAQEGKLVYRAHNKLLDMLSRMVGEGPQAPPNTIKAAVLKLDDELMRKKLTDKSWMEDDDVPFLPAEEKRGRPTKASSTSQGGLEELYRQENKDK